MTSLRATAVAALTSLVVVHSAPASAQSSNGGIASATVSAMSIEDGTSASIDGVSFPSPAIRVGSDGGHATIFTTNLRLTIPTRSRRISPYLVGGAGVGTVTENLQYTITYPPITFTGVAGSPVIFPPPFPLRTESITRTTTDFAATFGGGVGVRHQRPLVVRRRCAVHRDLRRARWSDRPLRWRHHVPLLNSVK